MKHNPLPKELLSNWGDMILFAFCIVSAILPRFQKSVKAQSMKNRLDKLGLIKTKNICSVKGIIKRVRREAID